MNEFQAKLKKEIKKVIPEIQSVRRYLHQNPEIGLHEFKTASSIKNFLFELGYKPKKPLLGTDVIVELKGKQESFICLRADIDALPIVEETGKSYASKNKGFAHSCGHDGHTAILLGTAKVLKRLEIVPEYSIRFIFQPGEEILAAGKDLVAKGCCSQAIATYALHGWPGLKTGIISCKSGPIFAAGALFKIEMIGTGCHGAMPEIGNNPILGVSELILGLEQLHQKHQAKDKSVISVCKIHAGNSSNVIPNSGIIEGTVRYLNENSAPEIENDIRNLIGEIGAKRNLQFKINYDSPYSLPTNNSCIEAERVKAIAKENLGSDSFEEAPSCSMANEDFAFYLDQTPGAMMRLGLGESHAGLHSPHFDFNDAALESGMLLFCSLALDPHTSSRTKGIKIKS